MQKQPFARDVLRDVTAGLRRAVAARAPRGHPQISNRPRSRHRLRQKLRAKFRVARASAALARLGFPLLVGTSRKKFIAEALGGVRGRRAAMGHRGSRGREHPRRERTSSASMTSPKWSRSRASPTPSCSRAWSARARNRNERQHNGPRPAPIPATRSSPPFSAGPSMPSITSSSYSSLHPWRWIFTSPSRKSR